MDSQTYKDNEERAKKAIHAWALKYNDGIYMNMGNAAFISKGKTFVKFDIIGKKYMVVLIDEKQDRKAFNYNNNPYGSGGLIGVALNVKPKSSWKDKNGTSFKILFIDVEKPMRGPRGLEKNVIGILLDTQKILELYNKDESITQKLKKDEYFVEDFIEFVNKANQ